MCVQSICNQAEEPQRATVAIDEQHDGHVDTYVSRRSLIASLKEAGAVQEAVRRVTDRINRHVYILARAPGTNATAYLVPLVHSYSQQHWGGP